MASTSRWSNLGNTPPSKSQKEARRAEAVVCFNQTHVPNRARDMQLACRICTRPHLPLFDRRIMYRMDDIAMMHAVGDVRSVRFRDEQDCIRLLRENLQGPVITGAVVVWQTCTMWLKRDVPASYEEAQVHGCPGCSSFWIQRKQRLTATGAEVQSSQLQDLVAYITSFEADKPCP